MIDKKQLRQIIKHGANPTKVRAMALQLLEYMNLHKGTELALAVLAANLKEAEDKLATEKRRRVTSTKINNELHERIEALEDK